MRSRGGSEPRGLAKERTVRFRRGHSIKLNDNGGGARKAKKALDDLDKQIRRLGGK